MYDRAMPSKRTLGPLRLPPDATPDRLDRALASTFDISRGDARRAIAAGGAYLNRHRTKVASRRCGPGDELECHLAEPAAAPPPQPTVIWNDGSLAVVDKPAGLPSAATRESDRGTLQSWADQHFGRRVHLPHRLDRPVRGLMLLVLDRRYNRAVARAFREGTVERTYRACIAGEPPAEEGRLVGEVDGRPAALQYRKVGPGELEIRLETGRTHQIRRQLSQAGCPVLGDTRYGGPPGPIALAAVRLAFPHPVSGERLEFELGGERPTTS